MAASPDSHFCSIIRHAYSFANLFPSNVKGLFISIDRILGAWVHLVTPQTLRVDALAGLLGAVLVLPQAIAFASLAGLPPQYGIYTAILPCIIAALAGSSWHVMSGPTNANSLALFAMLAPLAAVGSPAYIGLAMLVTILVGLIQLSVSLLRMGSLANFISPATLMGFTSGAALLIAVYAMRDALGIQPEGVQGAGPTLMYLGTHLADTAPGAVLVCGVTLAASIAFKRWNKKLPFMLLGLVIGTLAAALINHAGDAASLGKVSVVGTIPSLVPAFDLPEFDWQDLPELLSISLALSIIALGQSISIARALAARSGQVIDPNREFLGQGLSNVVGGFFSCYLSCGSLNRSLPNLESGARTPLAAVFSALWLILLVLVSAPLLAYIPFAAIAGLLLLVAWSLLDTPRWLKLGRTHPVEFGISLITMLATVTFRLEYAILLGTLLSIFAYLYRTSRPSMRIMGFLSRDPDRHLEPIEDAPADKALTCPQIRMLRMEGTVYFGAAAHVTQHLAALRETSNAPAHLLVMARSMNFIDLPGAEIWEDELKTRRAMGGDLYFHRPRPEVIDMWKRTGFDLRIGADHLFMTKRDAIADIFKRLDPEKCRRCKARIFAECASIPTDLAGQRAGEFDPSNS